jgi:hypothetical protein
VVGEGAQCAHPPITEETKLPLAKLSFDSSRMVYSRIRLEISVVSLFLTPIKESDRKEN